MENILMTKEQYIMDIFWTIFKVELGMKYGLKIRHILEIIKMGKKTELVLTFGVMERNMKENGRIILWMVLGYIISKIEEYI